MSQNPAVLRAHHAVCLAATVIFGVCALPQAAQGQKAPTAPRNGGAVGTGSSSVPHTASGAPFGDAPENESDLRLENLRNRTREADRQKRMVDDANRLVVLAARYRASISEHGSATVEDSRLLLEMEKLARSVKDRMRGM